MGDAAAPATPASRPGARRIAIVQGHPDPAGGHFGHALADAYADGARRAGHEVATVAIAALQFPMVRSKDDWEHGAPPEAIRAAQELLAWADHLVFIYPLWLGDMPAVLKAFLEQVARPGFIQFASGQATASHGRLAGKSARVVVTMGMPGFVYRWFFRAHSLKSLERNILRFVGIKPVRTTVIGTVETKHAERRAGWLERMRGFGLAAT